MQLNNFKGELKHEHDVLLKKLKLHILGNKKIIRVKDGPK